MSDQYLCSLQDKCPIVMAACERKVKAESSARLAEAKLAEMEAEYARKRVVMNELFAAGVSMRKAQKDYFKDRTLDLLEKSKAAEAHFDHAIQACRDLGKPVQKSLL